MQGGGGGGGGEVGGYLISAALSNKRCLLTIFIHTPLTFTHFTSTFHISTTIRPASVAQLDARLTGDQEVAGSTPAEVGNILSWRLILKYFLQSFSSFR